MKRDLLAAAVVLAAARCAARYGVIRFPARCTRATMYWRCARLDEYHNHCCIVRPVHDEVESNVAEGVTPCKDGRSQL
jgi:hypothetical protein